MSYISMVMIKQKYSDKKRFLRMAIFGGSRGTPEFIRNSPVADVDVIWYHQDALATQTDVWTDSIQVYPICLTYQVQAERTTKYRSILKYLPFESVAWTIFGLAPRLHNVSKHLLLKNSNRNNDSNNININNNNSNNNKN